MVVQAQGVPRHLGGALGDPEGAPLAVAAGGHVPGQLVHALLHVPVILRAAKLKISWASQGSLPTSITASGCVMDAQLASLHTSGRLIKLKECQ